MIREKGLQKLACVVNGLSVLSKFVWMCSASAANGVECFVY
jgi:hypothetical protein